MLLQKFLRPLRTIWRTFYPTLVVLGSVELLLRLFLMAPSGYFAFLQPSTAHTLYPRNVTIDNHWGPVRFVTHTNSLGLRGHEVPFKKRAGTYRIAAIGDSVTDGFYVDDEDTFEERLQGRFVRHAAQVEVINAARGGASIDKELAIYRAVVAPLNPDLVVLTFVTNDIFDILGKSASELLQGVTGFEQRTTPLKNAAVWLLNHSAVAEAAFRLYWSAVISRHQFRPHALPASHEDPRYSIVGGSDVAKNASVFLERYAKSDGLILGATFSPEVTDTVNRYLSTLRQLNEEIVAHGSRLLFVYFPAYPEVYLPNQPEHMKKILTLSCRRAGISFLDLTQAFKKGGKQRAIHLAPLDFHLNPAGNDAIAKAIYGFGRRKKWW